MRHVILYTDEDGFWIAEVPSLPGCGSDGTSKAEVLERVKEAIQCYVESLEINGLPVPDEYPNFQIATVEIAAV